jgi:hypothetical protein
MSGKSGPTRWHRTPRIRRQIRDDVGYGDLDAVEERTAAETKPLESIEIASAALVLDDKADRVRHRTCAGSKKTSPARIGISRITPSSTTFSTMSPRNW